jgi:putative intracellular protease/amidase
VATLCSGASALLGARNDDGSWPFVGKRITGFPTSEKVDFGVAEGAPWLLESRLTDAGAAYVAGERHKGHVEVDGNLVTGQNGASSRQTAAAVIAKLSDPSR